MKCASTTLTILALIAAVAAGVYWYRSTKVRTPVDDVVGAGAGYGFEPVDPEGKALMAAAGVAGLELKGMEAARLNRLAAIWTIVSAALAAAATIFGNLA